MDVACVQFKLTNRVNPLESKLVFGLQLNFYDTYNFHLSHNNEVGLSDVYYKALIDTHTKTNRNQLVFQHLWIEAHT